MRINPAGAIAAVFLCAAISTSAQTADPAKKSTLYGAGTRSCGTWLADRGNSALHNIEINWVLGFLSAADGFTVGLGGHRRETDANAVAAWIDNYCREHPLNNIGGASEALIGELAKPE